MTILCTRLKPLGVLTLHSLVMLLGVTLALLAWPEASHAASYSSYIPPTLGGMMCSIAGNLMPTTVGNSSPGMATVINGIAYVCGALTIGSGLLLLVKHIDDSQNTTPLHQPLWRLAGGAGLISFPPFIRWLLHSVAFEQGPGGIMSAGTCHFAVLGTTDFMMNLAYNIKDPLTMLLSVLAFLIGLVYIFRGLSKASRYGTDPRAYSMSAILSNLIAGAALVSVGSSMNAVFNSLFGGITLTSACTKNFDHNIMTSGDFWCNFENGVFAKTHGLLATQNVAALARFEADVTAALIFFQIIGFIAFIRGWMVLKAYTEGGGGEQKTMAAGLTHIFGGALAVNIYQTLEFIDYTFGTRFFS